MLRQPEATTRMTAAPVPTAHSPSAPASHLDRLGTVVLRDTWYLLGNAKSVKRGALAKRMLDQTPIVLWRDRSGAIKAMEDRCAHRRAPLSAGKIVDGCVQCPYHGWRYDADGTCVKMPSLGPTAPPRPGVQVPTYPVHLRYGLVWLWWGDAGTADPDLIPDIPFLHPDRPAPSVTRRLFDYATCSELVVENLLDLTHLDFVHGSMLGDPLGGDEDITADYTDEVVTMTRISEGRRPPRAQAALMGFPKSQDLYQTMKVYVRSGVTIGVGWQTPPGWANAIVMPNTPVSPRVTRQDGQVLVNIDAPKIFDLVAPLLTRIITAQDNRILGLQKSRYEGVETRPDKSVPADVAALRYRSVRHALVQRQRAGDFSYSAGWQGPDAAEVMRVTRPT